MSADTIVPGAANPQAWNRYSYTLNNPLRYIDPTGHMQVEDPYTSSNKTCKSGDTSCNWVGKSQNKPKKNNDKPKGDDGGFNPCHQDSDCQPFSDKMWTEKEIDDLNYSLGSYEDKATAIAIGAGVLAVPAAFIPTVGIPVAIGLAAISGLAFWEAHTANKLQSYLTDAKSIAHNQGGVDLMMSHRSDALGKGSLVTVEYEGPKGSTLSGGQVLSPILSFIFSMTP